jgi:hypothetical protein
MTTLILLTALLGAAALRAGGVLLGGEERPAPPRGARPSERRLPGIF